MEHTAGTVILAFLVTEVSAETVLEQRKPAESRVIITRPAVIFL